ALGVDPPDEGAMARPPRPSHERVITPHMWRGSFFVAAIPDIAPLLGLDASLPGGLIEGTHDMRYAHTMAFTTLVFFSLFTIFSARPHTPSALPSLVAAEA